MLRLVTEPQPGDDRLRGMGRWAVRFSGTVSQEAVTALKERHIEIASLDRFFEERLPGPSTTVVVQAAAEDDAIRRVRDELEGHGEYSGFQATPFVDPV